jgi:spoIIIJ-associated protein
MNHGVAYNRIDSFLKELIRGAALDLTFSQIPPAAESPQQIAVEFAGPDSGMLTARNAELLLALEHLATQALRLEPEEHDLISFEAGGFKAQRARNLQRLAEDAELMVQRTGKAHAFAPMSSRERRLLHLALASSGLTTQSEGEGAQRHLVLYPRPPAEAKST